MGTGRYFRLPANRGTSRHEQRDCATDECSNFFHWVTSPSHEFVTGNAKSPCRIRSAVGWLRTIDSTLPIPISRSAVVKMDTRLQRPVALGVDGPCASGTVLLVVPPCDAVVTALPCGRVSGVTTVPVKRTDHIRVTSLGTFMCIPRESRGGHRRSVNRSAAGLITSRHSVQRGGKVR